jgi:hypothetical protein
VTTRAVGTTAAEFEAFQAEVLKQRAEEYASEQAFRLQPAIRAKFYRRDGEVRFHAVHLAGRGGNLDAGDTRDAPATDAHRADYPAQWTACQEAEAAAAKAGK